MQQGVPIGDIGLRFHQTLIRLFSEICSALREDVGCRRVVLSGGVFQNAILLTGISRALEENEFEVYSHSKVPTNDGGISFGQAAVVAAIHQKSGA
jgi:hydrogenase maturation protein HypF